MTERKQPCNWRGKNLITPGSCKHKIQNKHKLTKATLCLFTLVELLLVIAIIAVLAALLLPSLSRAKEIALDHLCKNNLKQIGTGNLMYTNDFGLIPMAVGINWDFENQWHAVLDRMYFGGRHKNGRECVNKLWECPAMKILKNNRRQNGTGGYAANTGLMWNAQDSGCIALTGQVRPEKIHHPSRCPMIMESHQYVIQWELFTKDLATFEKEIRFEHSKGHAMNGVFLDGHVLSIKRRNIGDGWLGEEFSYQRYVWWGRVLWKAAPENAW